LQSQLIISKAIYEDCRRRNKILSIAWIDYQKAFDSVPHSWVEKPIELVGVNSKIVRFCNYLWRTGTQGLFFKKTGSNAVTTHSDTKRNIPRRLPFDIIFCTALITLTNELNRADFRYQVHGTGRKISHLLYMDDLKLLGRKENDLKNEMKTLQTTKQRYKYEFWFRKTWKNIFKKT